MVTLAHNGDLEYVAETTYGAGIPTTPTMQIASEAMIESTLEVRRVLKRHHTISTDAAVDTTYHSKVYVLTMSYVVQQLKATTTHTATTCIPYYAVTRSAGDLTSLACVYDTNGSAYLLKGAKINTYSQQMTQDEAIIANVEIWGNGLEVEDVPSDFTNYAAAGTIGEDLEIFEGASVTRSGSWTDGISDFNFTINNNMARIPKLGTSEAVGVYPAHTDLTGSAEIITAAGGEVDVEELLNATETDIVAQTGTTSSKSMQFTFSNAGYARTPVPYRIDMSAVLVAADWEAESVAFAAVT